MSKIEGSSSSAAQQVSFDDAEPTTCSSDASVAITPAAKDVVDSSHAFCADIHYTLDNPNADPKAAGSVGGQLKQAAAMGAWTSLAVDRVVGTNSERVEAEA